MVSAKLGIDLGMHELKNIYNIRKNEADEGILYMSTCSCCGLALKFLESFFNEKIDFYIFLETWAKGKVWEIFPFTEKWILLIYMLIFYQCLDY